MNKEQIFRS